MQNVEFASSSCSSKFIEAPGHWFFNLALGCEALFDPSHCLFLSLVCNSSCPTLNSSCSQLAIPFALGLQLLLFLVKAPFASSLRFLLLLVYSSSWSQSKLLSLLVGSSSCSQLVAPLTLGWQLFLFLVSGSSWSWSNSSSSWSVVLFNHD